MRQTKSKINKVSARNKWIWHYRTSRTHRKILPGLVEFLPHQQSATPCLCIRSSPIDSRTDNEVNLSMVLQTSQQKVLLCTLDGFEDVQAMKVDRTLIAILDAATLSTSLTVCTDRQYMHTLLFCLKMIPAAFLFKGSFELSCAIVTSLCLRAAR